MADLSLRDLADALAARAEDVCRAYLPSGRKDGRYWLVGNVSGACGRSLYVRLQAAGSARAGKWTDAATGEHGDLLDLIRLNLGLSDVAAAAREAQAFLALAPDSVNLHRTIRNASTTAARLWGEALSIRGTLGEVYLAGRGLAPLPPGADLRFHPRCPFREGDRLLRLPSLLAASRAADGTVSGIHRTALTFGKGLYHVDRRRALGSIRGRGVVLSAGGLAGCLLAGEGIETTFSLAMIMPRVRAVAALSAAHLGALDLPGNLTTLMIALDHDEAGRRAVDQLCERARQVGVTPLVLQPRGDDFNADLMALGQESVASHLRGQLADLAPIVLPS